MGAVKIFPLDNGPGTVGVIITDENKTGATAALINSVAEYIETVRPIGATVTVESAMEKAVNVSARVKLTSGTFLGTAQNAFQEAVTSFLQENAFAVEYVSLARIGNLLMGIPGVEDYMDLRLNGVAENVVVGDKEIAITGTVRLEAVTSGDQ